MKVPEGIVDYLCNAIAPDRETIWDEAIAAQGVPVKVRRDRTDSFADPDTMVKRFDELGVACALVTTSDQHHHGTPFEFDPIANRLEETRELAESYPGRFAGLWGINPQLGIAGVRRAAQVVADHEWIVGLYLHTHSFDRPFDHADYYPYYALCADAGVAMVMQAGTSGGLMPSECGRPVGIDRPAIYFADTTFVLSHTGWPWVPECVAMALKFPNVHLGTGAYPPRHWDPAVVSFLKGPGKAKVVFGTNFPTVGHRHALAQIEELDLPEPVRENLLGANARRIFARLGAPAAPHPSPAPAKEA